VLEKSAHGLFLSHFAVRPSRRTPSASLAGRFPRLATERIRRSSKHGRRTSGGNALSFELFHAPFSDEIAEEESDYDSQRHQDHLGHADLPEEDSKDDFLGVLDEDDYQEDKKDQDKQDLCFHFNLLYHSDAIIISAKKSSSPPPPFPSL
jgi:hypothetical protein